MKNLGTVRRNLVLTLVLFGKNILLVLLDKSILFML